MDTMTRRQAIKLVGIGAGVWLGHSVGAPPPLWAQRRLSIGTAGKAGVFYPLGVGMAALISKYIPGVEATAEVTGGSKDNMKLLHAGQVQLALAVPDVAWEAAQGQLKEVPERVAVRTLLATYSSYLHIVIRDLAATPGIKMKLIPHGDAAPKLTAKYPFYFAAPIPKGTYPGLNEDVSSAALTVLLVAHERMEEALAYEITKLILERTDELVAAHRVAKEITLKSAVRGSHIPFHPGAVRYYKEKGVTMPST